jgi:hypothetical protein
MLRPGYGMSRQGLINVDCFTCFSVARHERGIAMAFGSFLRGMSQSPIGLHRVFPFFWSVSVEYCTRCSGTDWLGGIAWPVEFALVDFRSFLDTYTVSDSRHLAEVGFYTSRLFPLNLSDLTDLQ